MTTPPEGPRLAYSVPETAALLKIGVGTAWRLVWSGEIPSIRLGGRVLVPRVQLEALLAGAAREPQESSA